jgi:hypothetical protein
VKAEKVLERVYDWGRLRMEWKQVDKNAGAAGIDRMTVEAFKGRKEMLLREIHQKLKAGIYRFQPARRVLIEKEGSQKKRKLGMFTVMGFKSPFIIFIFILLLATNGAAWEYKTPLGIRIRASEATINQYNAHWQTFDDVIFPNRPQGKADYQNDIGPKWETIDWNVIDDFYTLLQNKHEAWRADPEKLIISIRAVAYVCWGDHGDGYDFASSYGCIDGLYASNNRMIIHLGDDPGQKWKYLTSRPFCDTALSHELNHYFLFYKGDPCWYFEGKCVEHHKSIQEVCY